MFFLTAAGKCGKLKKQIRLLLGPQPEVIPQRMGRSFQPPAPEARIGMKRLDKFPESPFDN
jgi:hypothetical protein